MQRASIGALRVVIRTEQHEELIHGMDHPRVLHEPVPDQIAGGTEIYLSALQHFVDDDDPLPWT